MSRLRNVLRMQIMRVLGIDPSLTSLGYAFFSGDRQPEIHRVRPKGLRGLERLRYLRDTVSAVVEETESTLVAYEGYAMGRFAGGGRSFDLGELGGVLKLTLFERKIPILLVPPTCLKLFATGKGNADKDKVMTSMAKHRGQLFASDDEADAYALLLMGMAYCDARLRPRDRRHYQHVALRGCELLDASVG